ncbi:MAG TPA: hypothetical protein VM686_07830 [Polyangiaceae bacterium]|nr:hypothetical protein [Polyangiaceae bacterium]
MKLPARVLLLAAVSGCTPSQPPRWSEGGAPLLLPEARWQRDSDDAIEVHANGHVIEDGDLIFIIDRVGRITDEDAEPVALLFPDGRLAGTDDRNMGHVGVSNAAPPSRVEAWLAVTPDGAVTYFDTDGERSAGGRWTGCTGPAQRTCTLVTHLVAMRHFADDRNSGVSVGVGIGIGF